MTTKPKAKKFRIRRSDGMAETPASPAPQPVRPQPTPVAQGASVQPAHPPRASNAAPAPAGTAAQPSQEYLARMRAQQAAAAQQPPQASRPPSASSLADIAARRQAQSLAQSQSNAQVQPQAPSQAHPSRPSAAPSAAAHPAAAGRSAPPSRPAPPAATEEPALRGMISSPDEVSIDREIDAIRKEGLTGRQLRMARRVAQKHGLAPTSDFDAIRLLRANGIDPFKRSNMMELVVPGSREPALADPATQLPQTVQSKPSLPSTEVSPAERRTQEISDIQRDIARRRRRKLTLLLARLSFFIFLPTLLVAWYFYTVATPLYATKSEFLVLQADSAGGSGLGGLLTGTQFATNQDAIAVQNFLISRPAMQRLDEDLGYKAHFSQPQIDPIKRLPPNATDEAAYKLYKRYVKIGYDPTEGMIRMEVIAADPEVSAAFSEHLISYAEQRVDELSRRKREDQMREARSSLEAAKKERRTAQQRLVELQEGTLLDPQGEMASIRALINNVELQIQDKELELQTQLNNLRPNRTKVAALETQLRLLRDELSKQQSRLNDASIGDTSLAAKAAQIQMAQADLATADVFLQSALQNEKQTALEANRQVRYLTTAVPPVAPDAATYPRAFENSLLAFLVLAGTYLMISLTASILREQVST